VVSGGGDFTRRLRGDDNATADSESGRSVAGTSPGDGCGLSFPRFRGVIERYRPRPEDLEFEVFSLVIFKTSTVDSVARKKERVEEQSKISKRVE